MSYKWKPLIEDTSIGDRPYPKEIIAEAMAHYKVDEAEARRLLREDDANTTVWVNELYQVQRRPFVCKPLGHVDMVHLNIRRRDGAAVFDWRHRQLIKNQLVGPECEAVELYPAESRLVDTSNKYHLWCFAKPDVSWPFGWTERDVIDDEVKSPPGIRQRRVLK